MPEKSKEQLIIEEKARQYDIVIDIIEWIVGQFRERPNAAVMAPHLNTLGFWFDVQVNRGLTHSAPPEPSKEPDP